jgi:hypothetical protein
MRIGIALLACVILVLAGERASAQTGPSGPALDNNVWQNGTAPIPGYGRQAPNMQPTTQATPAGTPTPTPVWYGQGSGIPLAGGRFYADGTVGTFYDDNVFATNIKRLSLGHGHAVDNAAARHDADRLVSVEWARCDGAQAGELRRPSQPQRGCCARRPP